MQVQWKGGTRKRSLGFLIINRDSGEGKMFNAKLVVEADPDPPEYLLTTT